MNVVIPQCMYCKYYDNKEMKFNKCKAFPKGIPPQVILNKIEHNRKLKGQVGD